MKLRNKVLALGLAALAGFLASRPDMRKYVSQSIGEFKDSIEDAIESGKKAAALKEQELEEEIKVDEKRLEEK
ncbi:hypothetical protein LCGC14_1198350 [marine sediment metagenome]|uniref:Uncharacterized protein n=1 Tax=marine sediment metagenome TaxID=412755 RepID=A0A0F9M502_9ZZZZ